MKSPRPDRRDVLYQQGDFDPDWYLARYPDVAALDLSAEEHFLTLGHHLGRGLSSSVPSTSERPDVTRALSRSPEISYCIPVMDRLADLQSTLQANLDSNLDHHDQVEFIVLCLDRDDETETWIRSRFDPWLKSGYLRLIRQPPLPVWHFGQAKNLFRPYVAGRFYSSLDGDNYVTGGETEQLLSEIAARGETFLFHHFSGHWGDGTSGRISLPARLYRQIGYDDKFMPRQFDEVDLILGALVAYPGLTLLRYATDHHVLETESVQEFLTAVDCAPRVTSLPAPERHAAENPRADDYAARDPATAAMQAMNEALCFLKNGPEARGRAPWVVRLRDAASVWVDHTDPETVMRTLFGDVTLPDVAEPELFVRTSRQWPPLQDGPHRIVIDGVDPPIPEHAVSLNDTVLRPRCGHVLVADQLWQAGLVKALTARGIGVLPANSS